MAHPEFQVSTGKEDYLSGIACVKKNSTNKKNYERKDSRNDHFYFVLKTAKSKVIGKSQMYTSDASSENGIESIKLNAKRAKLNYL
jgi:uncharacterized protein YegP (UPF0339 family)